MGAKGDQGSLAKQAQQGAAGGGGAAAGGHACHLCSPGQAFGTAPCLRHARTAVVATDRRRAGCPWRPGQPATLVPRPAAQLLPVPGQIISQTTQYQHLCAVSGSVHKKHARRSVHVRPSWFMPGNAAQRPRQPQRRCRLLPAPYSGRSRLYGRLPAEAPPLGRAERGVPASSASSSAGACLPRRAEGLGLGLGSSPAASAAGCAHRSSHHRWELMSGAKNTQPPIRGQPVTRGAGMTKQPALAGRAVRPGA